MQRKLTAKVQRLSPQLQRAANAFSNTLVITPDNEEILESKGVLYTVFDALGEEETDPLLITKIVNDVLHDSYYQSENTSPIQSLEKAVVDVYGKVTSLFGGSASSEDFNILIAALWGNVLYLVQYGKGGSFLVREGEVKPIVSASEGNFSAASGVIKDDDVIILATESFLNMFPPKDLISTVGSISQYDLDKRASCLLLKFEVTASFGEKEKIDFGLEEDFEHSEKQAPLKRESPKLIGFPIATRNKIEMRLKSPKELRVKKPFVLIALVVALLLAASVYFTLSKGRNKDSAEDIEDKAGLVESAISEGPLLSEEFKGKYKIEAISPEIFYDIRIENDNAFPDFIVLVDNHVVVADSSAGNIYISGVNAPSFSIDGSVFPKIGYLTYFGGNVTLKDEEGYKVYDAVNNEVVETYLKEGLGVTSNYLDFVYSVDGDKLIRYEKSDNILDGSIWGQSGDFEKTVSMAIDGNIYILTSDGNLLSYVTGEKRDFEVKGLDKPFLSPVQVVTDFDLDRIYVADAGNGRVVVLDKDGGLVKQFLTSGSEWGDMKGIGITRNEDMLFVLSGSKIYKVEL